VALALTKDAEIQSMKKWIVLIALVFPAALMAQNISLGPEDLYMEASIEGGYHLYIRKKEDIRSVMLTNTSRDPQQKVPSFALRNPEYHPINGDEKRILNGEFLPQGHNSLIDSTPEENERFGEAFHIFIPYISDYGNPWNAYGIEGSLYTYDGSWLGIRTFTEAYGDYRGGYLDNPFVVRITQAPPRDIPDDMELAVHKDVEKTFPSLAEGSGGSVIYSPGGEDLVKEIDWVISQVRADTLDLVIALDTTSSMKNDIGFIQTQLIPLIQEEIEGFRTFRLGFVYYRDYFAEYLTKVIPFRTDLSTLQEELNHLEVGGGRDLPEAVYEGIDAGIHGFDWISEARHIILIGDAPPHPVPRGKTRVVTEETVLRDAALNGIQITTILLPQ